MDKQKIEKAVRDILEAIGENPDREGLKETPKRVAKMYEEIYAGIQYTNDDIAKMFGKCFDEETSSENMVVMSNIPVFSYCEHHLALMYNMRIAIGYIPKGKVIGLSKMARIADMVCRRLQLQERIGSDIAYIMQKALDTEDVIVFIEGEHSCMTARGIKKPGTKTRTINAGGIFNTDIHKKDEFFQLISEQFINNLLTEPYKEGNAYELAFLFIYHSITMLISFFMYVLW